MKLKDANSARLINGAKYMLSPTHGKPNVPLNAIHTEEIYYAKGRSPTSNPRNFPLSLQTIC